MKGLRVRNKLRRAKKTRRTRYAKKGSRKTRRIKQNGGDPLSMYPDLTEVVTRKSNGDYGTPDDIPTLIGSNKIESEEPV
jgi:hypothetical protein